MRLVVAVGTRPDVIRVAPLLPELESAEIHCDVAYAGPRAIAHPPSGGSFYGVTFPEPTWLMDPGGGTDAATTGKLMLAFENLFAGVAPGAVLVVGDSNTALAAAVSAARAGLSVIHVEAGLRCGDLSAPDEINRVLVSRVAAMHLTPTERALENLEDEGIEPERIHFVGASAPEAALKMLDRIGTVHPCEEYGLTPKHYVVASVRRPDNLRDPMRLAGIVEGIGRSAVPVLMPDASAFLQALAERRLPVPASVHLSEMVPYPSMLACTRDAAAVITDCGALAEEACVVGVPCLTVRHCTKQEATVAVGANRLVAANGESIETALAEVMGRRASWVLPKRWDRAVSDRVVRAIRRGVIPLS